MHSSYTSANNLSKAALLGGSVEQDVTPPKGPLKLINKDSIHTKANIIGIHPGVTRGFTNQNPYEKFNK